MSYFCAVVIMNFIYAASMVMDEWNFTLTKLKIPMFAPCQTLNIYLTTLTHDSKGEGPAKVLLNISTLLAVIFTAMGIYICTHKRYRFKSPLMKVHFPVHPVSKWLCRNTCSDIFLNIFILLRWFWHILHQLLCIQQDYI